MGDYPSDITRTAFRRMPKDRKRDVMIEWFNANYEDPAQRTPYETAEGGYQWIWGGPYDAEEEIRGIFEGLVSEVLISEVVEEVQAEGLFEWAPTPRRDDYDDNDQLDATLDPLDELPDVLASSFGSADEVSARQKAIEALRELEAVVPEHRSPGIGHNRPPDDFGDEESDQDGPITLIARELREELEKEKPLISTAKRLIRWLGQKAVAVGQWAARKADLVVDEVVKNVVRAGFLAPMVATDANIQSALKKAYELAVHWLHLATLQF